MTRTRLAEGHLDEDRLRDRLTPLYAQPGIQLVILFGSTVKGQKHRRSDLDLAILGDQPLDMVELTNHVITLTHVNDVDVIDLKRASPLLAMEVARSGRLLYEESPGRYAEFCSLAQRRFVDTAKLRAGKKEAIARFLKARSVS